MCFVHACNDIDILCRYSIEIFEAMQQDCPENPGTSSDPPRSGPSRKGCGLKEPYREWFDLPENSGREARMLLTPYGGKSILI